MSVGQPLAFIKILIQQRDYHTSLVHTWLIGVPSFVPSVTYLVPLTSYVPINILNF